MAAISLDYLEKAFPAVGITVSPVWIRDAYFCPYCYLPAIIPSA